MLLYTHTQRLTKPLGNFMLAKFKRATRGFRFSLFTHKHSPVEKCGACHCATTAKSIFHHHPSKRCRSVYERRIKFHRFICGAEKSFGSCFARSTANRRDGLRAILVEMNILGGGGVLQMSAKQRIKLVGIQ